MKTNKMLLDISLNKIWDKLKSTEKQISELNSNLRAADSTPFRFGVNGNGEYGYIIQDSEGADTFFPFKKTDSDEYRILMINALSNTSLELTEESTWDEIYSGLKTLYPDVLDLIAELKWTHNSLKVGDYTIQSSCTQSATQIYMNAGWSSGGTRGGHQCQSPNFDITGFKTLTCAISTSNLGYNSGDSVSRYCRLYYTGGSKDLSTGTIDVSSITGDAYVKASIIANGCGTSITISQLILKA